MVRRKANSVIWVSWNELDGRKLKEKEGLKAEGTGDTEFAEKE
jgi:hypothetical protein